MKLSSSVWICAPVCLVQTRHTGAQNYSLELPVVRNVSCGYWSLLDQISATPSFFYTPLSSGDFHSGCWFSFHWKTKFKGKSLCQHSHCILCFVFFLLYVFVVVFLFQWSYATVCTGSSEAFQIVIISEKSDELNAGKRRFPGLDQALS